MDWTQIGIIAAVLVTLSTALLNVTGALEKLFKTVGGVWVAMFRKSATPSHPPSRTLIAIKQPSGNALWWHMGSTGGAAPQPLMQVSADFNVTNIWNQDILIASAAIRVRRWWRPARIETADAMVLVKDQNSQYSGQYPIAPNVMSKVRVGFMIQPPPLSQGKTLIADVALVDQFNNSHWLIGLKFPHM
jgi:hypothetical protein